MKHPDARWICLLTAVLAALALSAVLFFRLYDPVSSMVEKLTLREKIGQMMMLSFRYWDEEPVAEDSQPTAFTKMNGQVGAIVADYNIGAVIYFAQNLVDTEQSLELSRDFQLSAIKDGGIPLLICTDQEGGSVYRLGSGTALPGNMALSAAEEGLDYARISGRIIGSELSALGINCTLAPVVDVNSNAANPVIGLRSFSDMPVEVGRMAAETLSGLESTGVIGCAKHFPGHGDTATDSHYGLPSVDKPLSLLLSRELLPFQRAVTQGVDMIMTAHILYPQLEKDSIFSDKTGRNEALPATMSDDIVTGLLKNSMGFQGIVISDAMDMQGVTDFWDEPQAVINAICAGVDMICMPCQLSNPRDVASLEAVVAAVEKAVEDGRIPESRIDDAVSRILRVKSSRGILSFDPDTLSAEKALAVVGSEENRRLEREMAAAAVTVVENLNDTLPLRLDDESRVLMLVPYNNEKAQMILGWNRAKEAALVPEGAEVKVLRFDKESSLETFAAELDWADTLIISSEVSAASQMAGGSWVSAYVLTVLDEAQRCGKTAIVMSVDKPYDVQCYPKADAVVAVYGCKGSSLDEAEVLESGRTFSEAACGPNIPAGIEVILGVYGASGKLPVDIPRFSDGSYIDEPAYPRGHGIHYESPVL